MRTRILAQPIVAAVLVWAGLASSAAAQGVGAIGGTVSDTSGAALPGVSVSLSNPGVIGGDQSTVTDERGAYQFTRLVPGSYSIRASLQGSGARSRIGSS
jgi:Carboxypeptidase regulatory-like domain